MGVFWGGQNETNDKVDELRLYINKKCTRDEIGAAVAMTKA